MSKREDRVRELLACSDSPLSAEQLNARKGENEKTFSLEFLLSVPGVRFEGVSKTFKIGPQPSDEEIVRRIVREELLNFLTPSQVSVQAPGMFAVTAAENTKVGEALYELSAESIKRKPVYDYVPGQMGADPGPRPVLVRTTSIDLMPTPAPEPEIDFHPTEEQIVAEVEELKKAKALEFALTALCEIAEDAQGIDAPEGSKTAAEALEEFKAVSEPLISDAELDTLKEDFNHIKPNKAHDMALALKNGAVLRLTGEATGRSVQFEMVGDKLMQDGREADMKDPRTLAGKFISPLFSAEPHFRDGAIYDLEELF
ncbi:MAG: hypothetical protein E6Q97_10505 [Desulfurellales bacterium]|nr:MAG: hypothetical protein E6Q97_10505 [Desulfurellales bacterium]